MCTIFFPIKLLGFGFGFGGGGGAVVTSDDNIALACTVFPVRAQNRRSLRTPIGDGERMNILKCVIVSAKLEGLEWEIEHSLKIGNTYNELAGNVGAAIFQQRPDGSSVVAQYTVFIACCERVRRHPNDLDSQTIVCFPVIVKKITAYKHPGGQGETLITRQVSKQVMRLPTGPDQDNYLQPTNLREIEEGLMVD